MSRNIEKYCAGNNCAMRRNHATSSVISRLTDDKPLTKRETVFPEPENYLFSIIHCS